MTIRHTRDLTAELHEVQRHLACLTLRVAEITNEIAAQGDEPSPNTTRPLRIGDRVSFVVRGRLTYGTVVIITTHRVKIRQDQTNYIIIRAPHNVTLLTSTD
jgi:hypothetical protein